MSAKQSKYPFAKIVRGPTLWQKHDPIKPSGIRPNEIITGIGYEDIIPTLIHCHVIRRVKLARSGAAASPGSQKPTIVVEFLDAMIAGVRNIDVAAGVNAQFVGSEEFASVGSETAE